MPQYDVEIDCRVSIPVEANDPSAAADLAFTEVHRHLTDGNYECRLDSVYSETGLLLAAQPDPVPMYETRDGVRLPAVDD